MIRSHYLFTTGMFDAFFTSALFIILLFVLGVSIISTISQRGKPKTNRGFQLLYAKLSYRRKFIRNLWTSPLAIALFISALGYANINPKMELAVILILAILVIIEVVYNYTKWKKHEA